MKFDMLLKAPLLRRPRGVKIITVDFYVESQSSFPSVAAPISYVRPQTMQTNLAASIFSNRPSHRPTKSQPEIISATTQPTVVANLVHDTHSSSLIGLSRDLSSSIEISLEMTVLVDWVFSSLLSRLDVMALSVAFGE